MFNVLSQTKARSYAECPRRYKLWYINRLRPVAVRSSLFFGKAIDCALNELLILKDLDKAKTQFLNQWSTVSVNGTDHPAPTSLNIIYSASDYDFDLLDKGDIELLKEEYGLSDAVVAIKQAMSDKEAVGFEELPEHKKKLCNHIVWFCLYRKGLVMIRDYNLKIMPKFTKVLAVQEQIASENEEGDKITGYLDLVVELENGDRYLLDNKTSTLPYATDAVMRNQQLILYYAMTREKYNLKGVGFVVMLKRLDKDKKKVCSVCGFDGSGARHKTCSNEIEGKRCGGEWIETINPTCDITMMLDKVSQQAEELVMEAFDEINFKIKHKLFAANFEACKKPGIVCDFFEYCHKGRVDQLSALPLDKPEKT